MSEDVDFILSDIQAIQRPPKHSKPASSHPNKQSNKPKSFQIEKSFIPKPESQVHEQLRPEVEKLKQFLKAKQERERKMKEKLAEGLISKEQFEGKQKEKKAEVDEIKEKYVIDQSGQLRDKQGNLVYVKSQARDLKINEKQDQELIAKQLNKKQKIKFHEKLSKNLRDRNLVVGGVKKRIRRSMLGFQFLEKGSYQSYSGKVKKEVTDLEEVLKEEGDEPKIIKKRMKTKLEFNQEIPLCQWWDREVLTQEYLQKLQNRNPEVKEEENEGEINFEHYIDIGKLSNQVTYQKVGDQKKEPKINMPVYLTEDERKKLKRKRKREKLLQKNDMIKLGLIEPEKPRLKISNMAIVMKDEFIIDPSKIQAEAKKQQEQRLNKHLQTNQDRKLTKKQKKEKIIRKLKRDSAKECRRIVFLLQKLENPTQSFKINMNAKQLALNGFVMKPNEFHRQPILIIAEGGQKAIRFFRNLMLNRIKWNEEDENSCKLLWEGQIENSKIGKWRTYEVGDQSETIRTLTEKNLQNFGEYLV